MNTLPSDDRIDPIEQDDDGVYEDEEEYVDQRYRAVNVPAVLSLVFGALSFLTVFHWFFGLLPAAGILLGMAGLRQINRSLEEMQGRPLAIVGMALSVVLWASGASCLAIWQRHSVPPGYEPITFATLEPDKAKPDEKIPEKAAELNGKRIFIKGYMYPGRTVFNLKQFLLVPSSGLCKFCITQIAPTQMIRVELVGDLTADYKTSISAVGGKLQVEPSVTLGKSPYVVEADVVR